MEEKRYRTLYAELSRYETSGIRMRLGNYPASPMQIVSAHMVREEPTYMRDYILDEKGFIKEVAFHQIENE